MNTGLKALKISKEIAQKHHAEKIIAVTTASFRKAKNVQVFIDKIKRETGITVYIIDQELEGILGFEATKNQLNADPQDVVVWHIGGGSFQFSALDRQGNWVAYRGVDASIPFKNHVIQHIKKQNLHSVTTPNPLTQTEMEFARKHARLIAGKVDALLKEKIENSQVKVVGIGNIFAYGIYPLIGKKDSFTQKELLEKIQHL